MKIRMDRKRWGLATLLAVVLFLAAAIMTNPPSSYKETRGETLNGMTTRGVFRPGGYVEFEFSPPLESLQGKYRGSVKTAAMPPEFIVGDEPLWPETGSMPIGRPWGSSMSGSRSSMKRFTVKHRADIPNEENLRGREVVFCLNYDLFYPVYKGPAPGVNRSYFADENGRFSPTVEITLEDRMLSAKELAWRDSRGGWRDTLATLLVIPALLLFFYAGFNFLLGKKSG